jgi:arginyl-tRNA synthetase
MWLEIRQQLTRSLAQAIHDRFGVEHEPVLAIPPRRDLGDLASPAAMQLAKLLKRNPRAIAEELATELASRLAESPVREVKIEGAGYLNFFLHRAGFTARLLRESPLAPGSDGLPKLIIEHTNINPNKAAHIGHLRNAVLGDVLGRTARALGYPVEIQNYIDDTGVQLADVVVGFADLRGWSAAEVAALPEPFDFLCWDLYSEVGRWFEEDKSRQELRRRTLHELESGQGERAELGRLVARRIVSRHLGTMARLGIGYDLLTHESDILASHFFDQAFAKLKESGAVQLESEGKNLGCWVMPLSQSEEFAGLEDPDKVIVRSDGTVTYVGKDIAYQMWKFGLLGRDFGYRFWEEEKIWVTTQEGQGEAAGHPAFGGAWRVINVIDARQSYLQKIVRAGLQALGHAAEAERSIHFAYEMVSLSPATARALGFLAEDGADRALEMSGRKGIGVKADDLLDQLIAKSREKVAERNADRSGAELDRLARQIATAALRFFMLKATTTRIIAFDFEEALSFEGDSGPYLQYALVRANKIRGRLRAAGLAADVTPEAVAALPEELFEDDLWDLVLTAALVGDVAERANNTLELSLLARHALEIAQRFNAVYHRHPILQEPDAAKRAVRLAAVQAFERGLGALIGLLGIESPEIM